MRGWSEATGAVVTRMRQLHMQPSDGVVRCVEEIYLAKKGVLDGDDVRVIAGSTGYAMGQLWRHAKIQNAQQVWDKKLGIKRTPGKSTYSWGT